ncbi:MAG: hypothetical protein NVS2B14_04040 [Chamaesiphon sp.]
MNFKSLATFLIITTLSLPLYRVNAKPLNKAMLPVWVVENYIDQTASYISWKNVLERRKVNPRTGAVLSEFFGADYNKARYIAHLDYVQKFGFVSRIEHNCKKKEQKMYQKIYFLVISAGKAQFVLAQTTILPEASNFCPHS